MAIYHTFLIFACTFSHTLLALAQATQTAKIPDLLDELSPSQRSIIHDGGRIIITDKMPGQLWPAVRVYQIIAALPEQVMAVFFDYEAASTYVPHLRQSTISKKIDGRTHEVDYRLSIPVMPDERYTVRNSLNVLPGGIYEIDWKLLRATTTRASEGNFRVQSYGKSKTIFCYSNIVVPGSRLAIILRGLALEQVQKNVDALITQVAKQKSEHPESLRRQVETLYKALGSPAFH